jgi:hypothetical protein
MDAKQVRKILDDVCANLDRRRAQLQSSILGRYVQPVSLGLALGLGGAGGCGSDGRLSPEGDGSPSDARVDASRDIGFDLPPSQDLYGKAVDVQRLDVKQDSPPEVGQPVDLYGLVVDARLVLDAPPDVYGVADRPYGIANWEALPPIDSDIYAGVETASPIDAQPVDGGPKD